MRSLMSYFAVILTVTVLLMFAIVLTTCRLEYCGSSNASTPRVARNFLPHGPSPTLATSQNLVFVQVESDKPDIEIRWAEN
jgi:hypothetical protein